MVAQARKRGMPVAATGVPIRVKTLLVQLPMRTQFRGEDDLDVPIGSKQCKRIRLSRVFVLQSVRMSIASTKQARCTRFVSGY